MKQITFGLLLFVHCYICSLTVPFYCYVCSLNLLCPFALCLFTQLAVSVHFMCVHSTCCARSLLLLFTQRAVPVHSYVYSLKFAVSVHSTCCARPLLRLFTQLAVSVHYYVCLLNFLCLFTVIFVHSTCWFIHFDGSSNQLAELIPEWFVLRIAFVV